MNVSVVACLGFVCLPLFRTFSLLLNLVNKESENETRVFILRRVLDSKKKKEKEKKS